MIEDSKRWALISVSEKAQVIELAKGLTSQGIGLISTGGTAKTLREAGVELVDVSDYTGHAEVMGGRVKTLHPKVHGGILARDGVDEEVLKAQAIYKIDFVIVNLYPFQKTISRADATFEEAIENIDIGGPALLRAAAKNHRRVTVMCDPSDYSDVLSELSRLGNISSEKRLAFAAKAFRHTTEYDSIIAEYLTASCDGNQPKFRIGKNISLKREKILRYGENPHQEASLYETEHSRVGTIACSRQLAGKQLSFNNVSDADTANECVGAFAEPACCIVKHANPCGVAEADTLEEAYHLAYSTDATSAFGGVIAFNRPVAERLAEKILNRQFVEVVVAPSFEERALTVFSQKENVRILELPKEGSPSESLWDIRSVSGGILVQERDRIDAKENISAYAIVSKRRPTPDEEKDLLFAWKVAAYVKSNAIVFASGSRTLGIGAGQMSRIYSAKLAGMKADDEGLSVHGAAMASDAFFPFRDGVDEVAKKGISAIIQPGGSVRDSEVIAAADDHSMAMLFTGRRHFRH